MEKMISNIVFSKNRPLQLDGYLKSLYRYFRPELFQTYLLYKVELFEEEYRQLFCKYPDCIVMEENDFHDDFVKIVNQVNTKYILFGIDDVVFFDSVDIDLIDETFREHEDNIFGFTLRFSPESLENSNDVITEVMVNNQKVYGLNWKNGQTAHSRYPFELCATIYHTPFIQKIISSTQNNNPVFKKLFLPGSVLIKALGKVISVRSILKSFGYFYSPNTLESWNCRWCQNNSELLPNYLYFQKICASAIQVNIVNTSTNNTFNGDADHTVESLSEKYREGYRLDIDFVAGNKPTGPHCGKECLRLIKK